MTDLVMIRKVIKLTKTNNKIFYLTLIIIEFLISSANTLYFSSPVIKELVAKKFGSWEYHFLVMFLFSLFFPLVMGFVLKMLGRLIPYFKRDLLTNSIRFAKFMIASDILTAVVYLIQRN